MATIQLLAEIPEGAEITVTLTNGKTFTGSEATLPAAKSRGVLRLEQETRPNGDKNIFFTTIDQVACIELVSIS